MSLFVLDTDILTLFQFGHPRASQHLASHVGHSLAVTVITVEEQLTGWLTALRRAKNGNQLSKVYDHLSNAIQSLRPFQILSFNIPAIKHYDLLKGQNLGVKKMDLRIAAIALEQGATLVTRNTRDFQRVPGLALVAWSV